MQLNFNEVGVVLRINRGFDMSSYTELSYIFTKPDNTRVTKTTADGVRLGVTDIEDPNLGMLTANEYMEYYTEPGLLNVIGWWFVQSVYEDTVANQVFKTDRIRFEVRP